ncbi:hypothetical protein PSN45_000877 [Yamadazyma tenuis]|uniref:Metallo-dependent hydrolase n=1 Tax=Candida tenuis (strain ATCC 10573 / BCRC 21748 / CBS 615 / JCM 9827 / NBRC 10315 / NRRL Y-1498 / VKM Y-70) TaxID=590646 RepID=G3BBC6_CANTC|nr:Metallo-dependent hydrolase [Yamadazyma tenuis ATCC 10573]XP_006688975.1 uncharacterized protein CANTEDRAFT_115622 [Yamadazyma tenuis ATCC 10573]EGV62804.1 Metallo-dependent hydrolase [Yamadazyma tenuis ATCC 10573]EGV62805.1 hypothetical protein CANTEDRAFT_115622 [Yamadazyma tenuis ATCC 10573]WEJ93414.1 hypothetical protein PSN45_000877 [Yamadazyma tenuis]
MPTAYINGNVHTVDDKLPKAEAFIVSDDGTFSKVGATEEIKSIASGMTVIDLKGQFVMPGMHDAHCHLLMASKEKLFEAKLGVYSTPKEIVEQFKEYSHGACAHLNTVSNWLIGNFYHYAQFDDKKPDRKFLDEAFGDQPVVIREYTTHNIFANSAALRAAGYEENPVDPWDGYYVRREDGTITGELVEGAATRLFNSIPKGRLEDNVTALEYGVKMSNRFGFTAVQEASANTIYLEAAQQLEKQGKMTINLDAHVVFYGVGAFPQESVGSLHHTLWNAKDYKSKHFNPMFTKCWIDGVPWHPHETHTPLTEDGKVDYNRLLIPQETFKKYIERFDSEGRVCKVHVCGQGSARFALDCFEALRKKNPNGPKHELAHNMDVTEEDCKRYKDLNITAEMSPAIWHDPDFQPETNPKSVYPFNHLKKYGALLTIGSDWVFAPDTPNIFPGLQALTENKHGWDMTREEVIKMVTINGAEATSRDTTEGTIESGKLANFVILDRDLTTAETIADTVVYKTYFEGREVYDFATDELKHFQGSI